MDYFLVKYDLKFESNDSMWSTLDPAEQFHNPYLAMANNPVRYTDPSGMTVPNYDEEAAGGGNNTSGIAEFQWNIEYGGARVAPFLNFNG